MNGDYGAQFPKGTVKAEVRECSRHPSTLHRMESMHLDEGDQVSLKKVIEDDPRPGRAPKGGHPIGTVFTFMQQIDPPAGYRGDRATYIQHLDPFDMPQESVDAFKIEEELFTSKKTYYVVTPTRIREEWWEVVDSKGGT